MYEGGSLVAGVAVAVEAGVDVGAGVGVGTGVDVGSGVAGGIGVGVAAGAGNSPPQLIAARAMHSAAVSVRVDRMASSLPEYSGSRNIIQG